MYQIFYGISVCNICNNDGVCNILHRNMLSSEQKLAYSLLCCMDQNSWQLPNTALNIYSSQLCFHPLNHNHVTKEASVCHSVQVFLHARLIYDSMQCVTGAQPNDQSARRWNAHKHIFFASKMFVTPKSITNRPCRVLYTVIPMSVNYKKTRNYSSRVAGTASHPCPR